MFAGDSTTATYSVNAIDPDLLIIQGKKYTFRISAKDSVNASYDTLSTVKSGLTQDSIFDDSVQNVTMAPCDVANCSTNPNVRHKGFETKITWDPAMDSGVGTSHYLIYRSTEDLTGDNYGDSAVRSSYHIVGVLPYTGGAQQPVWYDNDANNDGTTTFYDGNGDPITISPEIQALTSKTQASTRLSDYVIYYYRIVAVDANNNKSTLFNESPTAADYDVLKAHENGNDGTGNERTPDVTAPSIPAGVNAVATGIDSQNSQPDPTQGMLVSWDNSSDNSARPITYKLYRSKGTILGPGTWEQNPIYTGTNISYQDELLDQDTYYFYRVTAQDPDDNLSDVSDYDGTKTKNSQVPTTPTYVTVTSLKGDPATDSNVGHQVSIQFNGSAIRYSANKITGYEVYRSTTNLPDEAAWLSATKVKTFSDLNVSGYEGNISYDVTRQFTDTVPNDSTSYFYKVRAIGQNSDGEVVSGLSAVQVGTLHYGWDTTPDVTPPDVPSEVQVKDIHGNDTMVRNIITWKVIAEPSRNGVNDYARYEIWRYETDLGIGTSEKIAEKTDMGDNYHVDGLPIAQADIDYSYYIVSVDNAGTTYKYPNGTIINAYSNTSNREKIVNINPGQVRPIITSSYNVGGDTYKTNVTNIGVSSATVIWQTNQLADSLVEYRKSGTSDKYIAAGDTEQSLNHDVRITALQPNTTYEYRVRSVNSLGNSVSASGSEVASLKTSDFSISNIAVATTTTTAQITWKTQIASDSNIEYKLESGTGPAAESETAGDPQLTVSHEVVIKALSPGNNYTYKVRSVTADKYVTETQFLTFRTKDFDASQFVIAPNASEIAEQNITATSAKIVWNTAIPTTSWIDYGTEVGNYNQSAGDDKYNTVHVIELLNLTPGKTYYYQVRGKDVNGIEYTSKEYNFEAILQPEVKGVRVEILDSYTAVITFETNVDTDAVVTYGKNGAFDKKSGQTNLSKAHRIELKDLEDNSTYEYYIEVKDRSNETAKTERSTFKTPIDRTGPTVSDVKIDMLPMGDADTTASVIISWTTSKPATTKIEYDEGVIGGRYGKSTVEDPTLNNSHTVILKDLNPGSSYHFRIASKDKRGNMSESKDYNFLTPTQEKSILQLILKSLEDTFSWVRNLGNFFAGLSKKTQ